MIKLGVVAVIVIWLYVIAVLMTKLGDLFWLRERSLKQNVLLNLGLIFFIFIVIAPFVILTSSTGRVCQ